MACKHGNCMAIGNGSVPTDQTGSVDSDVTKSLVDLFGNFAKQGADIALDSFRNREGRSDRGTGGGDKAGEAAKPWWQQPIVLIAAAAVVIVLLMRRR